jgi:hypothetical protein
VKLAQQVQDEFEYVIWRSLSNASPLKTLLEELVPFVSDQQDTLAEVSRLLHYLRTSRCLLILDNLETILDVGQTGRYRPGYEGYGELLKMIAEATHQSCLILTSRERPAEIATFEGVELAVRSLRLSGAPEAAHALLQAKGLVGKDSSKQELCNRYGNSPLALKIVATSIKDLFDGEIGKFLEQDTTVFNGIRRLLEEQFNRLSPLEQTGRSSSIASPRWSRRSCTGWRLIANGRLLPSYSQTLCLRFLGENCWKHWKVCGGDR